MRSRSPQRRLAVVLFGAAAGVVACTVAVFAVLGLTGGEDDSGGISNSGAAATATPSPSAERAIVPDACTVVGQELADRLAPDADRQQADTYQANDRQNQCVWGAYTSAKTRVLTVELRAVDGTGAGSGADAAAQMFKKERQADESGDSLATGLELSQTEDVVNLGDEGYVVYAIDKIQGSGEAIANVRAGNILVTVHYSGTDDGDELEADPAIEGAIDAAEEAVKALK